MAHSALLEYVVVHELAHLRVRNHSPDFWNLVIAAAPDAKPIAALRLVLGSVKLCYTGAARKRPVPLQN